VTDRRTDRRTDGQTELRWLRRAESIAAFARKNFVRLIAQNGLKNMMSVSCCAVLVV